ncbi:putative protein tyrosine phosphatase [Tieghemostelium lacteum]|uniref:protein-tyrosine-phosphatase n=1 Tax=Tieghemostelium lacteum TaxID=361077 RepID=A0A151ZJP2_TIELA|nr:putative protein tyrosine phosphatase [Tieghemostelium lacteum]|eukprot:KYQ94218.1 putative protein tyrosine phosphatase [Tieghemostelium lacteum]
MFKEGLDGEYWKLQSNKRERKPLFSFPIVNGRTAAIPTNNIVESSSSSEIPVITNKKQITSKANIKREETISLDKKESTSTLVRKSKDFPVPPHSEIIIRNSIGDYHINGIKFESTRIIVPIASFVNSHPELLEDISRNQFNNTYIDIENTDDIPPTQEIVSSCNNTSTTKTKRKSKKSAKKKKRVTKAEDIEEGISRSNSLPVNFQSRIIPKDYDLSVGYKVFKDCNIWVGGKAALENREWVEKENVKSFVNVTNEVSIPHYLNNENYRTLRIKVSDSESEPLYQYFQQTIDFIQDSFNKDPNASVLIHCKEGRSRSTTIAIVYGMKILSLSLKESYENVAQACPRININVGFLFQLMNFEKSISGDGKNSIDFFSSNLRRTSSYSH